MILYQSDGVEKNCKKKIGEARDTPMILYHELSKASVQVYLIHKVTTKKKTF